MNGEKNLEDLSEEELSIIYKSFIVMPLACYEHVCSGVFLVF